MFDISNFDKIYHSDKINFLYVDENKNFNWEITKLIPEKTEYLIMNVIDKIKKEDLERLKNLKYIWITSTWWWDKYFDTIVIKEKNIITTNVQDYSTESVVEAIIWAIIAKYRYFFTTNKPDSILNEWIIWDTIYWKNVCCIGMGYIWNYLSNILSIMWANIYSPTLKIWKTWKNIKLEEILPKIDIITLHVPKSSKTILQDYHYNLIKNDITIVNVCWTELISPDSLIKFLSNNQKASYIDFSSTMWKYREELSKLKNTILFPSISNKTYLWLEKRKEITIKSFKDFLEKKELLHRVI
jgi:phosphoglycerate dehydrogenase-like enzyme